MYCENCCNEWEIYINKYEVWKERECKRKIPKIKTLKKRQKQKSSKSNFK